MLDWTSGRDHTCGLCMQEFNRGLFDYLIATDDPAKAPAQQQQVGTKRKADVLEAADAAGLDDEPDISATAQVREAASCSTSAWACSCSRLSTPNISMPAKARCGTRAAPLHQWSLHGSAGCWARLRHAQHGLRLGEVCRSVQVASHATSPPCLVDNTMA